jgi:hypothetical protein
MVFQSLEHARANIVEFCYHTDPEIRLSPKLKVLLPSSIYAEIFYPTLQYYIEKQCANGDEVKARLAQLQASWSVFHESFTACEDLYIDSIVPTITKMNAPVSALQDRHYTRRIIPIAEVQSDIEGFVANNMAHNMAVATNVQIIPGENDLIIE